MPSCYVLKAVDYFRSLELSMKFKLSGYINADADRRAVQQLIGHGVRKSIPVLSDSKFNQVEFQSH